MPKIKSWFDRTVYIDEYNPRDNNYTGSIGLHEPDYIKLIEYEGYGNGSGEINDAYNMLEFSRYCGNIFESKFGFCQDKQG